MFLSGVEEKHVDMYMAKSTIKYSKKTLLKIET